MLNNNLFKKIIVIFIIGSLWVFLDQGCIFKKYLHIPCPGCGMTRAWYYVLHGDFKQAFYYHPLFWTLPLLIILFLIEDQVSNKKIINLILYFIIFLFLITYIIRLITKTYV